MCSGCIVQIAHLCRFVSCFLFLVSCCLLLVACCLLLVACCLLLVAKNCVRHTAACQVLCFTFMRFFVRMVVFAVGAFQAFFYHYSIV